MKILIFFVSDKFVTGVSKNLSAETGHFDSYRNIMDTFGTNSHHNKTSSMLLSLMKVFHTSCHEAHGDIIK